VFQFEQFVVEDLQSVFDIDGLISSHPVYVPVSHPDEINEIFDRISYAKVRFSRENSGISVRLDRYMYDMIRFDRNSSLVVSWELSVYAKVRFDRNNSCISVR